MLFSPTQGGTYIPVSVSVKTLANFSHVSFPIMFRLATSHPIWQRIANPRPNSSPYTWSNCHKVTNSEICILCVFCTGLGRHFGRFTSQKITGNPGCYVLQFWTLFSCHFISTADISSNRFIMIGHQLLCKSILFSWSKQSLNLFYSLSLKSSFQAEHEIKIQQDDWKK